MKFNSNYDYLVIGAGIFGCSIANILANKGKTVLIIDINHYLGGMCHDYKYHNINIHRYGAHIFHTSNEEVWSFINQFTKFNNYINSPIAKYKNEVYNLPFNMNTFYQMWGVTTPKAAKEKIESQLKLANANIDIPKNLEEQAIKLVGKDIYEKLIKGYTEKQWNMSCNELSPEIMKRIPVRFTYDNNYFNDKYQGVPVNGYNDMFTEMLKHHNITIIKDCPYSYLNTLYPNIKYNYIIYTGSIDEYSGYSLGKCLPYRSVKFKETIYNGVSNFQGNAVVNYTSSDVPYTRKIEHKFFETGEALKEKLNLPYTIVSTEFPTSIGPKCYPINTKKNMEIYNAYLEEIKKNQKVETFVGGRLGEYKYMDMDKTIASAISLAKQLI